MPAYQPGQSMAYLVVADMISRWGLADYSRERLTADVDYSVVGPRDNRVHEIETTKFPFNTVCHVSRDFGDGSWRGCSGVLIGPRSVLTAGHCLYSHKRGKAPVRILVSPGRRSRSEFPFRPQLAIKAYVPRPFVTAGRRTRCARRLFDYGVLVLPRGFPGIKAFMPIRALTDRDLEALKRRKHLTIAGYPGDRPIGTMWRHSEQLMKATPRRLFYTVDTCPGHSGSPIWCRPASGAPPSIVGIHTSGVVDQRGRPFGCRRGTVLAPPNLLNSGIRITSDVLDNVRNPTRGVGERGKMLRIL